jgi:hypothetical protein
MIYYVGSRFKNKIDGKKYHIVGAINGSPDGLCCLASMKFGWSYTGEMYPVKNCHEITQDEIDKMMGGHTSLFKPLLKKY